MSEASISPEEFATPQLGPASLPDSLYGTMSAPPLEVELINEMLSEMKGSLGNLGSIFDSLGQQTTQMVQIGGELETAQHLNKVRKEMQEQDHKQVAQIDEIKELLQQALQHEIIAHLRQLIEAGVLEQIDEIVKEKVAEELKYHLPPALRSQVTACRQQLAEVQQALHNSESRRANALLKSTNLAEPLHTIYKTDGTISSLFPQNMDALLQMDVETAQRLMADYEMPDVSEIRERNLNRFMQFCGVSYQLVMSNSAGKPGLSKTRAPVVMDKRARRGGS